MSTSERITANELAELRENSGDPSYLEDAATYYDDAVFKQMLILGALQMFDSAEDALLHILTNFVQYETCPDWIEKLIDRVARERFGE